MEFNEPALFDDIVSQIKTMAAYSCNAETGLFYHGRDERGEQQQANICILKHRFVEVIVYYEIIE